MLSIAPSVVRLPLPGPGYTGPLGEVADHGVRAVEGSGILGDPTGATAEEGVRLLAGFAADLVTAFDGWVR